MMILLWRKRPGLRPEEAVELALKNSYKLKNAREDVERSKEILDRISNLRGFGYTPVGPGYSDADAAERELLLNFVQADIAWQMARKQVEMVKEGIAFQVRSAYDEVLKKINESKVAGLKLENAAAKMRQADIKAQYGMESLFNLQLARDDYNAEKQNKELLDKQLEEAYLEFNVWSGWRRKNGRCSKVSFAPHGWRILTLNVTSPVYLARILRYGCRSKKLKWHSMVWIYILTM